MSIKITSTAFQAGGSIPSKYTCEDRDLSPPLAWSGAPPGTKSFALIVDDPDAPDPAKPQRVYVHWVIYNIPAATVALAENASKKGLPKGAVQGKNDWGKAEYGGPCPPIGRHRYFFKLYALDTELTGLSSPTKGDLERVMKGHVLDSGELIGTYQQAARKK
ncbi:MAG: YbhB/YbcL family Raf kinase inhibitor-like protein [Gemmatimonadaceae bacterium]